MKISENVKKHKNKKIPIFPLRLETTSSAHSETRALMSRKEFYDLTVCTASTISLSPELQNCLLKCDWALIVINGFVFVALTMRMVTKVLVRLVKSLCITPCARYQP